MRRHMRKVLAAMLAVAVSASTANLDVYAMGNVNSEAVFDKLSVSAGDVVKEETVHNGWDGASTQDVYEGNGYKVSFALTGHWDSGFNASVRLENTGDAAIENWYLGFDFGNKITGIWNAETVSGEDGRYTIKNAGWNQDIAPGGYVEFGFSGTESFKAFPQKYELAGTFTTVDEEAYSVAYHVDSDWGSGFTGTITITNNTSEVLEDWVLEFDFDREITGIWDGVVESWEENHYVIRNARYNSNMAPGQKITVGFTGRGGASGDVPYNYVMYSYTAGISYKVRFDVGEGDVANIPGTQTVQKGMYAAEPQEPTNGNILFLGWYLDREYTQYFDFENTPVEHDITLYALWFDTASEVDTDGDGLTDELEKLIETSPYNADTDGDGLTDYWEIAVSDTDPLLADTDGNGTNDGKEDSDGDGLNSLEEAKYGTHPFIVDTDGDGLGDGEEVHRYGTDPTNEDTDGDTLSDYEEVLLGFDPLKKDTDGNGVPDGEEFCEQTCTLETDRENSGAVTRVDVSLSCPGFIGNAVSMADTAQSDWLSAGVVGLVGIPVEIHSEVEFDEAVITFYYDETLLGDSKESDLCMMWYDEENDVYVLLEDSAVDETANTVSYTTTHFSTYLVIDKTQWFRTIKENAAKYSKKIPQQSDSLVLPGAGTVYKCFEMGMTWEEAKAYCEKLGGHLATITSGDEQKLIESLMADQGYKNSYWLGAERDSRGAFSKWVTGEPVSYVHYKDGRTDNCLGIENALMIYRNNNPNITGYCFGYWNDLSKAGTCKNEGFFGLENMGFICEWNDVELKDTDGDGVPDIYEEGYILSNGRVIRSNPGLKDTDGDGLSDYDEMGGEPEIMNMVMEGQEYLVLKWRVLSDPSSQDTDGDGLLDGCATYVKGDMVAPKDPNPRVKNGPDGIWERHVEQYQTGTVATRYSDSYHWEVPEFSEEIEGFPENRKIADAIVRGLLMLKEPVNDNEKVLRWIALLFKMTANGKLATVSGAYLLNFIPDADGIAYHSQNDTWQRYFGYNDLYDDGFRIGSFMNHDSFEFSTGKETYSLWMWKGDYWNLHSGAEIGLYRYVDTYSDTKHYEAVDFEVPMTLSLYNYYSPDHIDNVFSWDPDPKLENHKQWWITGFSGQKLKYLWPHPNVMVAVGSVDFSGGHEDMFYALKNEEYQEPKKNINHDRYLIFDETYHKIWVIWYEGVKE